MCACVINTASKARGSKGGSCQLRSRNSLKPWNKPQSTSTRALPLSIRYFDPVTVPTPPQNEIVANEAPYVSWPRKGTKDPFVFLVPFCGLPVLRGEANNLLRRVFHTICHCE